MECNRDEAVRAKEMAEKKFATKDYMGSKTFALKAQNLFPGLSGIPQMLAVLDVYISAEKKINGEADWYGILGVDPTADDGTMRKKYKKLALVLHPDKNGSPGADGAFMLIAEAWSLLSDKAKRAAYDQKIRNERFHRNVSSTVAQDFPNFTQSTNFSAANGQTTTTQAASFWTPAASSQTPNTFRTMCPTCLLKYEYLLIYLHHYLRCHRCQSTLLPIDIAPPIIASEQFTPSNLAEQWQNSNHETTANRSTFNIGRSSAASAINQSFYHTFSRTASGFTATHAPSVDQMAQTATGMPHAFNQASGASTTGYANNAAKRRCMDDVGMSRYGKEAKNHMDRGAVEANFGPFRAYGASNTMFTSNDSSLHAAQNILKEKTKKEMKGQGSSSVAKTAVKKAENGNVSGKSSGNSDVQCDHNMSGIGKQVDTKNTILTSNDISLHATQNILKEKTRKKMSERGSSSVAKTAVNKAENGNERGKSSGNSDVQCDRNMSGIGKLVDTKNIGTCDLKQSGTSGVSSDSGAEILEAMTSIDVPDPDFHNFDEDRTEKSFKKNHVWAAYDEVNGMPRYYAKIQSVSSLDPFTMRISWLDSKTNRELGPLNWVSSGFSKTCGEFRVGKHEECKNALNSFSHKVWWKKGARGTVCIYPRKGDVWAL
ncbi:putative DnaJ domain-containing protein [Rosa chinensis]|uniref:Putative DnaJ domain-containing protein n=1 Tax=Rosa chinensis TaxID=74649 RepID=A0A2P6PAT9_ROSCH|nr:putative DnaJ domain-containing protein [Rosa chinensis]